MPAPAGIEPRQHILDILCTEHARFDDQFDRYQHRCQAPYGYGSEHLRHHPVAASVTQQPLPEPLQRGMGRSAKVAPLRSAPGLRCTSGM